jgi:spore coat polysaccharide biosynthesis protein SpsF (cytidylyltransferase family)|tara:strand:+ start:890 stop:1651 length:762 start_codon:yes stop_codon:yes gene_type:complete
LIGCIIQARVGSSRLPKKILKDLDKKYNVLEYVINQLKSSNKIDKIIIATTISKRDEVIVNFAKKYNYEYFRGSENDVLDRFYQCAKNFNLDTVVRITSDCPLIDPKIVDEVIKKFTSTDSDYVTNTFPRTFPKGLDVEIFNFRVLTYMWENAILPSEREHVTQFLFKNKKFKIGNYENKQNLSDLRWTIDYEKDYEFLCKIVQKIEKRPILMNDVLKILESEPKLKEINSNIDPNEGLKKSQEEDKKFLNKN